MLATEFRNRADARIVASLARDCGRSCPRSYGDAEGSSGSSETFLVQDVGCNTQLLSDRRSIT